MQYHFPDDPRQIPPAALYELEKEEPGRRMAQLKWDGFRRPAYKNLDHWTLHAKHSQQKLPPPQSLLAELDALAIPNDTAFDMEWMGNRAVANTNGRHWFVVFDLLYDNGEWLGETPFEERYSRLSRLLQEAKNASKLPTPNIELGIATGTSLMDLFEKSKTMPLTEGIVTRTKESGLIGNLFDVTKNPLWNKIKWRQ